MTEFKLSFMHWMLLIFGLVPVLFIKNNGIGIQSCSGQSLPSNTIRAPASAPKKIPKATLKVEVDSILNATQIEPFWASTGLSPVFDIPNDGVTPPSPGRRNAGYLLSSDEFINIALIGSLPKGKYFKSSSIATIKHINITYKKIS